MIITKTQLRSFRNSTRNFSKSINESLSDFSKETKQGKVTIFLSHKHDELEDLDSAIALLKSFGVEIYVDWQDSKMPTNTNGDTAVRLKQKIKENKKFVLLATESAIASKWCNWELGFGDAEKYKDHIALLPVRNDNQNYLGSEYLQIYPVIEYLDGTIKTTNGNPIPKGYYIMQPSDEKGSRTFIEMKKWLGQ